MASLQTVSDWRCHDRFYFSDGSLHLLVEDSLYCVHRSLFEKYANKFPIYGKDAPFGDPYTLKDVKQIDFDRLLACLYPDTLLVAEAKTSEEWTSILKLASKWGFESLRSRAIRKLKRTLNTPVDMVAFGRQYDIPDILLPGYAILCQIDIYRIRHELHGSDITVVSFEDATAKVKAFISNEGRKDDGEVGTAKQRDADFDDEKATDVGSVSSSWVPSIENDRKLEAAVSMADINLPPSEEAATTVGVEKLGCSKSEHRLPNAPSPIDGSGSQGGDTQLTLEDVLNMPGSTSQGRMVKFLDILTMDNFNVVSVKILQWVNDNNDSQTLYHVTRLIVEKAVNNHGQTDVCIHLCKEMIKKVSGQVQGTITKKSKSTVFTGISLFREYLGEVCQEKLEDVSASVTAADTSSDEVNFDSLQDGASLPEIRRRRLIRFISKASDLTSVIITSRAIIKKWIAALLDAENEEKLVTLSMLLDSAGARWDASTKLKARIEMMNIAQKTDNASRSPLRKRNDHRERLKTYPSRQDYDRGRSRSCTKSLPPKPRRWDEWVRSRSPGPSRSRSRSRSRSVTRRRRKSHSSLRSRSRDKKERNKRDRSTSSSSRDSRRRKRDKEGKRSRSQDERREGKRREKKEKDKEKHLWRTQLQVCWIDLLVINGKLNSTGRGGHILAD
ncbi:hypothetical protein JOM56_002646 [Amanita muscaria]